MQLRLDEAEERETGVRDESALVKAKEQAAPVLTIVSPTYNERLNVRPFTLSIAKVMKDVPWEVIFVDDDSPDGTCAEIIALSREGFPVRVIRRIGRRGLASAVVEGAMSARSDIIAVMDSDMQHDEAKLPEMLRALTETDADVVVASRMIEGGGMGDWSAGRQKMSALATQASRLLVGQTLTDPMSGYFMTRRSVFDRTIYDLSQQGYKILLDILSSSSTKLKVVEIPDVFRSRARGSSKIDTMVLIEYGFLIIDKLSKGLIPPKFVLFAFVGGLGLGVHLVVLRTLMLSGSTFLAAQTMATLVAMAFNFLLNNYTTYRSDRLSGFGLVTGYFIFAAVCSLGAFANISVANLTMDQLHSWPLAGIAGAIMSSVFNFGVSTRFVWRAQRRVAA
ncbi:MAG: glycosyltransferase family 2 protein [Parafilimonas terrae]|nr:glycosyltransferase family 2 protein [Parafilimonas terrae]